jgi:hypothetical protein
MAPKTATPSINSQSTQMLNKSIEKSSPLIKDKCRVEMLENKCNKSQKHRWKFNEDGEEVTVSRSRKNFHNKNNFLLHQSCPKLSHVENDSENLQQRMSSMSSCSDSKPQERANSRRLTLADWMTACSVRKLLPIFILVNMLPFLYAGEYRRAAIYLNYTPYF